jgi:thioredoxin-related protein
MRGLFVSAKRIGVTLGLVFLVSPVAACAQSDAGKPAKQAAKPERASIYDKEADANQQIEKATGYAKKDNKRILLMFGGDWCGWCHKLHELFKSNQKIAKILYNEYRLVMIDTQAPNAAELLEKCKAALSPEDQKKVFGVPFLAVLDTDGKIVTAQRTDPLEEGDHHSPERVEEFLNHWKVPPKDGKAVLAESLARASSDDKKVFLRFGAPWCGWCHRLDDWLAQPEVSTILDRDFVVAKVDIERMISGNDVMLQFRSDASGGIPWYVVLDAKGNKLTTADAPGKNIGYPFSPEEIDQFLALVKDQAHRIDAGGLDELRKSLNANAEKFKKPARP